MNLDEIVAKERHRRERLKRERNPYRHWRERGDPTPPEQEFWCEECVGFFGAPHDGIHVNQQTGRPQSCPNLARALNGNRVCACIECACAEQATGPGSLASRVTES